MEKITVNNVHIDKQTIAIFFSVTDGLSPYFIPPNVFITEYNQDLIDLPENIAVIPFLCNILPIIWLTNSELILDEIDQDFYNSIDCFKKGYIQMYPMLSFQGTISAKKIIENTPSQQNHCACFFSAGIDAFATLIAHLSDKPDLISLRGSDIDLNDSDGWRNFETTLAKTKRLFDFSQKKVTSNFRKIINEGLLNSLVTLSGDGWWHGFQHGIGLIGHAAPLAYLNGYKKVYIASSYTIREKGVITCASDPSIDNYVKFCKTEIIHDQYEFSRQEKVEHICNYISQTNIEIPLHVCWESKGGKNCCHCEKCYRTIAEIIAEKGDPTKFNFLFDSNIFSTMKKDIHKKIYMAPHIIVLWKDIQQRLKQQHNFKYCSQLSWIKQFNFDKVNSTFSKRVHKAYIKFWSIIHSIYGGFK